MLRTFTLYFDDEAAERPVQFRAYVFEWDDDMVSGPALYQSPVITSTNNSGAGGYEAFGFAPNLVLEATKEYVAFFSKGFGDFDATWAFSQADYTGGGHVGTYSNDWTRPWTLGGRGDFPFYMEFAAVPEPGVSFVLLAAWVVTRRPGHQVHTVTGGWAGRALWRWGSG